MAPRSAYVMRTHYQTAAVGFIVLVAAAWRQA
jgi:hypothetical protein